MNNIGQSAGKNLAWLAGFLEGDGSIALTKQKMSNDRIILVPGIRFSNTDALIIEECGNILKENNVGFYYSSKYTANAISFDLVVKGFKRVQPLLNLLIPELHGKKLTIAKLLDKWLQSRTVTGNSKTYTKEELNIYDKIAELHNPSYPQRLHARPQLLGEDIVRTVQKCAELSRNAIADL